MCCKSTLVFFWLQCWLILSFRIIILRKLWKWEIFLKNSIVIMAFALLQFLVSGNMYSLEGNFRCIIMSFHFLFNSLLLHTYYNDCVYHVQCFFLGVVHVKSGNKLCNSRSARFSKPVEVSLFRSCPLVIIFLGLCHPVHLEVTSINK